MDADVTVVVIVVGAAELEVSSTFLSQLGERNVVLVVPTSSFVDVRCRVVVVVWVRGFVVIEGLKLVVEPGGLEVLVALCRTEVLATLKGLQVVVLRACEAVVRQSMAAEGRDATAGSSGSEGHGAAPVGSPDTTADRGAGWEDGGGGDVDGGAVDGGGGGAGWDDGGGGDVNGGAVSGGEGGAGRKDGGGGDADGGGAVDSGGGVELAESASSARFGMRQIVPKSVPPDSSSNGPPMSSVCVGSVGSLSSDSTGSTGSTGSSGSTGSTGSRGSTGSTGSAISPGSNDSTGSAISPISAGFSSPAGFSGSSKSAGTVGPNWGASCVGLLRVTVALSASWSLPPEPRLCTAAGALPSLLKM